MNNNVNKLRELCKNVANVAEPQFDFASNAFQTLIPADVLKRVDRIIISGCGDSYLAAAEATGAFQKYLAGTGCKMEAPRIIEATRFVPIADREPNTMVVAISASGGPSRVLELVERGNKHGCITVALTHFADSRAAKAAEYVYLTHTEPDGPGLCSYYASLVSLFVMAATIGDVKTGKSGSVQELRKHLMPYHKLVMDEFDQLDKACAQAAEQMKDSLGFEVVGDGPLFACGEFVSAKYAETAGEKCTVIDSENYFHVNNLLCPSNAYGTMLLAYSDERNIDRIAAVANSAAGKAGRKVLLICDKAPQEIGITESVSFCPIPLPEKEFRFIGLLYAYLPGSLMASYQAALHGATYFFNSGFDLKENPSVFTIATSEITVL